MGFRTGGSEIALDRGQRHVGHGSVDKSHAGTDDGRGENPMSRDHDIRVIVSGRRDMVNFVWMLGNVTHGCPQYKTFSRTTVKLRLLTQPRRKKACSRKSGCTILHSPGPLRGA